MCRLLFLMLLTVLLIPHSKCGRIVQMHTFFKTVSSVPHLVPANFLSKTNLRLAIASPLRRCVFEVYLVSMVIPMYVALSLCCSLLSSNTIFMWFDFVDKVKSVVPYFVLFMFTRQSCAQIDMMLAVFLELYLAVVAYYSVLHRIKSFAYIAPFTGDGFFL